MTVDCGVTTTTLLASSSLLESLGLHAVGLSFLFYFIYIRRLPYLGESLQTSDLRAQDSSTSIPSLFGRSASFVVPLHHHISPSRPDGRAAIDEWILRSCSWEGRTQREEEEEAPP